MMWLLDADGEVFVLYLHTRRNNQPFFPFFFDSFLIEYKHFGTAVSSLSSELFIAGMSPTWARTTKGKVCAGWYVITFGMDSVDPSGATNTT